MKAVELSVEAVVPVVRTDKPTILEVFQDTFDGISVVIASLNQLGDGTRLVKIVEHLKTLPGQQLGEVNMRVLEDESLVDLNSAGVRRNNPLPAAVAFLVDQPLLGEVRNCARDVALAMVELGRNVGDRVAAFDGGEDPKFDASEHAITQYETHI